MLRRAFLLGLFSIGGQVLLLRELVSSLGGSELLIGTALFGWLLWVAIGAWAGGRLQSTVTSDSLFIVCSIVLPVSVIAVRLSPLLVTNIAGEIVPFTIASCISILAMLPVGSISGGIFSVITQSGTTSSDSIVQVYLFEGVGAFFGGIAVTLLLGSVAATLGMSLVLAAVVVAGIIPNERRWRFSLRTSASLVLLLCLVSSFCVAGELDRFIDSIKYRSYEVQASFDTRYTHQAILSREDSYTLLTDNTVEGVSPDLEMSEDLLLPPLAYRPNVHEILFVGRTELSVAKLVDSLQDLSVTAVDPRRLLTCELDEILTPSPSVRRVESDVASFLSGSYGTREFDIVVLQSGLLDSYRSSRLITERFMRTASSALSDSGILFVPTNYDTDRYVTSETEEVLSIIYNVLEESFEYVTVWPGNTTPLFASNRPIFDITNDTIFERLSQLAYTPHYINENYLVDRLNEFKVERLLSILGEADLSNSLERPLLTHAHTLYRSRASDFDRVVISVILKKPLWILILPVVVVAFFLTTAFSKERAGRFGLFLYFVAGVVSLSLELLSFYLYQTMAGSLYSQIAVLIGSFMLGLAAGTYVSSRVRGRGIEKGALFTLLGAVIILFLTFNEVHPQLLLVYHSLFLFVVAVGTGTMFVAATNRYYGLRVSGNRGTGYSVELIGSSLGALVTTTVLLPIIGLTLLLGCVAGLLALALIGSACRRE